MNKERVWWQVNNLDFSSVMTAKLQMNERVWYDKYSNLDFSSVQSWPIPVHFLLGRVTISIRCGAFSGLSQFKSTPPQCMPWCEMHAEARRHKTGFLSLEVVLTRSDDYTLLRLRFSKIGLNQAIWLLPIFANAWLYHITSFCQRKQGREPLGFPGCV